MRLALTKRTDYAIRAFLCLARSSSTDPLPARRIAADMAIPPRFVPHVLGDLVRAGLAEATPGKRGGYRAARGLEGLTLLEVIEALDGPEATSPDGGPAEGFDPAAQPCLPGEPCNVERALLGARQAFVGVLAGASFADFVGRPTATADPGHGRARPERNIA